MGNRKTINCGTEGHDEECLCDVKVSSHEVPIRMKNLVTDMKFGEEICELRGYTQPWDREQIINFLEDVLKAHDTMRDGFYVHRSGALVSRQAKSKSRGLLEPEQRDELRRIIIGGASYTEVISYAKETWNVEVSKSYAAHLRKRTLAQAKGKK